jgi:site-specific recombinase XerC
LPVGAVPAFVQDRGDLNFGVGVEKFTDYLIAQRRLGPQTLASYRDTFRLLLQFVHRETKVEPSLLTAAQLDADIVLLFLDSLEQKRGNAVVSRNLGSQQFDPSFAW